MKKVDRTYWREANIYYFCAISQTGSTLNAFLWYLLFNIFTVSILEMNSNKGHSFKAWLLATRPWSFPASSMPVLVTLAFLAWKGFEVNWLYGVWAIVNIIVFHAAGNTWSDYFDYKRGVDREDTIGGMSIVSGEFKAGEIKRLAWVLLLFAVAMGLGLMLCTGLYTLYFGLAGCLLIVAYPWLKYHALGDVDIFLTYSVLPILGTSFVATGEIYLSALWLSVPIGFITVGILHSNNARDIEHDRRAGIYTFAMLIGRRASALLYCFEVLFPFIWVAVVAFFGKLPLWSLLVLVAMVPAVKNSIKAMRFPSAGAKALYGVDEATAQLQLMFSLLLTISLFIPLFL